MVCHAGRWQYVESELFQHVLDGGWLLVAVLVGHVPRRHVPSVRAHGDERADATVGRLAKLDARHGAVLVVVAVRLVPNSNRHLVPVQRPVPAVLGHVLVGHGNASDKCSCGHSLLVRSVDAVGDGGDVAVQPDCVYRRRHGARRIGVYVLHGVVPPMGELLRPLSQFARDGVIVVHVSPYESGGAKPYKPRAAPNGLLVVPARFRAAVSIWEVPDAVQERLRDALVLPQRLPDALGLVPVSLHQLLRGREAQRLVQRVVLVVAAEAVPADLALVLAPAGRDSIVVAEGITAIDHYAFSYCNLQHVELPLSLQTIDHYAFSCCNALQSVVIPDGVTKIGANLFRESLNLRSVLFGRNLKEMGNYSFMGCASIDTITILASEPPTTKDLSLNADSCLLRVFQKSYSAYAKHEYWSKFANISTLNTIELDVNNEECGTVKGAGYYDTNTDVVIEAQAFEGYEFVDWSDGATDNPRTINLVSDIELIANFRVKENPVDVNLATSDAVIYFHENVLHVENISTDYQLYDIFGRKIYVGSDRELNLTSGVYLIVIENKIIKIVV